MTAGIDHVEGVRRTAAEEEVPRRGGEGILTAQVRQAHAVPGPALLDEARADGAHRAIGGDRPEVGPVASRRDVDRGAQNDRRNVPSAPRRRYPYSAQYGSPQPLCEPEGPTAISRSSPRKAIGHS